MANLKELRLRIRSIKSTQKVTSAMKMIAASRLRRAQEQANAARPYAMRMDGMLASVSSMAGSGTLAPRLLAGTGKSDVHLLVIMTSDRGLAGGFNASILREARRKLRALFNEGRPVKLLIVGRKGRDNLRRDHSRYIVASLVDVGRRALSFGDADDIARRILQMYEAGEFDVCTIIYNRFKSTISQIVTSEQLIPFAPRTTSTAEGASLHGAIYEFEPSEEEVLEELLRRNLAVQIYVALLESAASEQGARMTAMDNATRNAADMIERLTIIYNRTRQAYITKELIEIISGAEAL